MTVVDLSFVLLGRTSCDFSPLEPVRRYITKIRSIKEEREIVSRRGIRKDERIRAYVRSASRRSRFRDVRGTVSEG